MQLDIFEHSRDVMLRNDVVAALGRRDPVAARTAWRTLGDEFPADEALPSLDVLVSALERRQGAPFANHDAAAQARLSLQRQIEPAALRQWGQAQAVAWTAPLWRELAQRAAPLAFRAERSDDHAAPLWLRAGDGPAAIDAVGGIESWRRIPAPLAWMAEARCLASGLDGAWPLLAELAWLSPQRFDALAGRLREPALQSLRRTFDGGYQGDGEVADLAWFPAWVLTEKPALARLLAETQPALGTPPEQGLRLMLELLRLERAGRHAEMIERRKVLRGLCASLYGAYLKTR